FSRFLCAYVSSDSRFGRSRIMRRQDQMPTNSASFNDRDSLAAAHLDALIAGSGAIEADPRRVVMCVQAEARSGARGSRATPGFDGARRGLGLPFQTDMVRVPSNLSEQGCRVASMGSCVSLGSDVIQLAH